MTNALKPTLGRLERVELRQAWLGEATDFTPWLARSENITLLGDAIGIELEVESQEKSVGPFRADILCRDTLNGHYVLVENQLERTDHSHLGQLLTYAAGLDAVTVVWVAGRFTDEHRAALDWLNNATSTGFNFFGLEIELWRIGASPLAPKFNVVSKPNDWSKTVKEQAAAAQAGELTTFQQLHMDYWTRFREFLVQRGGPIQTGKPSKDAWTDLSLGRTGYGLVAFNAPKYSESGVNLSITVPDAKAAFALIEQRHRTAVDARLVTFGTPEWRLMPDRKESQVRLRRPSSLPDQATWPELMGWMAAALEAMNELFRPIVKTLNTADWAAPATDVGATPGAPGA